MTKGLGLKSLYEEFGLSLVKNDMARRDLFWYNALEKFGVEFGERLWYDPESIELAKLKLPKKLRKKIIQDALIQVGKIDGNIQRKNQPSQIKTSPRIVDTTNPTACWVWTVSKGSASRFLNCRY